MARAEAEAETPILWPPDVKSLLTGKMPSCCKSLRIGGEGDDRVRRLGGITDSMDMSLSKLWETVKDREVHGVTKSQTRLSG